VGVTIWGQRWKSVQVRSTLVLTLQQYSPLGFGSAFSSFTYGVHTYIRARIFAQGLRISVNWLFSGRQGRIPPMWGSFQQVQFPKTSNVPCYWLINEWLKLKEKDWVKWLLQGVCQLPSWWVLQDGTFSPVHFPHIWLSAKWTLLHIFCSSTNGPVVTV
jgi:hypothetical protein